MKRSHPGAAAVAGGIGALPFGNSSFPTAICVAVAHHLEASTLHRGLAEIARVVSGQFVFVDAVRIDGRWLSSILWRYDRGRFPRTRDELLAAIGQHFTIEKVVDYRFLHCYVLCVAKPLAAPAPDILLRPVEVDDAGRMLQWMQDPEVRFNLGVRREPSMERTIEWIRRSQQEKTIAARAIMMQGRHVGNVVLDQIDRATGSARLSIYIGAAGDRLGGIGRRAIALLLDEGFASLGLKKVWLSVAMDHSAAIRCYTAVGFRRERILQQRHFAGSEVKDCLLMVVLREDWWR